MFALNDFGWCFSSVTNPETNTHTRIVSKQSWFAERLFTHFDVIIQTANIEQNTFITNVIDKHANANHHPWTLAFIFDSFNKVQRQ